MHESEGGGLSGEREGSRGAPCVKAFDSPERAVRLLLGLLPQDLGRSRVCRILRVRRCELIVNLRGLGEVVRRNEIRGLALESDLTLGKRRRGRARGRIGRRGVC